MTMRRWWVWIILSMVVLAAGCATSDGEPLAGAGLTATPTALVSPSPSLASPVALTPTAPIAPTATATPALLAVLTEPVSRPEDAISTETVGGIVELARWSTDARASNAVFSPDGRWLAVTGSTGVYLFDAGTLETARFIDTGREVDSVAFSPDGEVLASGAYSFFGRVSLWRTSDGALVGELESGRGSVGAVAFSPDGTMLVSGVFDGSIYFWGLAEGQMLGGLEGGSGAVSSLAFAPDGQTLASGTSEGSARLWRVADGSLLNAEEARRGGESRVTFSANGTRVAVAGGGDRVTVWRGSDGMPLLTLDHPDTVQCIAFSPDGALLATGAADGVLRFWLVDDRQLLHSVPADVSELAFSPDGRLMVSTADDRSVRFWGVDWSVAGEAWATPTPTPAPWPTSPSSAPFHALVSGDVPPGTVQDVWVSPEGEVWLVTDLSISAYAEGEWVPLYIGLANRVLGMDSTGRVWVAMNDGWRVASYEEGAWTFYGTEEGWTPGYGSAPVVDGLGRVWMVEGESVRFLDPETGQWTALTAAAVGFGPLEDMYEPVRVLTALARDQAGNVWVGSCIQDGIVIAGQGVRWFDGEAWRGSEDTAGECVHDIVVDGAGRVWMTGFDALIQYDPAARAWTRRALPEWERRQLITSFALDAAGNPWVEFIRFGATGPWHSTALYRWENEAWVAVYDPEYDAPVLWDFGPDGTAWVCSDGVVYRSAGGEIEQVGVVGGTCAEVVVDGVGRVWVEVGFDGEAVLWRFDPE
ncbi:MAG: PD40 domain-containing protein [Anaerolineae bacterium]|nr:PD40 domain-containing protein [Anaerolineae bacterium]